MSAMNHLRLIAVLVLLLCFTPARAARPTYTADPDYLIDTWETEDGLPENSATSMVQMEGGYLVFGTFGGLVRFDGVKFTRLGKTTSPQAPEAGIVNIHLDRTGRLWVSSYRGTGVIEGNAYRQFEGKDGFMGDFVRSFSERDNGDMLLTMFDGTIQEYREGKFHALPRPPGNRNHAYMGHVGEDGAWWVVQHEFIGIWKDGQWIAKVDTSKAQPTGSGQARDGGLWLLVGQRLTKYRQGQPQWSVDLPEDPGGCWGITEDSQGHVWITTHNRGICRIEFGAERPSSCTMRRWRAESGLIADGVRFLFEDREGTLWVGTSGGGLARFKSRSFQSIDAHHGLPRRVVTSLAPQPDGSALIGTYGGGVSQWDGANLTSLPITGIGGEILVQSVLKDSAGRTWIGMFGSPLTLLDKNGQRSIPAEQTGGNNVIALFEDSKKRLWISGGQTVAVCEGDQFRVFPQQQEASLYGTHCFAEDHEGTIWLTNGSSVMRLEGDRFVLLKDEQGQKVQGSGGLTTDRDGTLWIMTANALLRRRDGKLSRIHAFGPLRQASAMQEDDLGNHWIAASTGIVRISSKDLHAMADGKLPAAKWHEFDKSDGLPSLSFAAGRQPRGGRDGNGRIWFATQKGVVFTDPTRFTANGVPPAVRIEEVSYFRATDATQTESQRPGQSDNQHRVFAPFASKVLLPAGSQRLQISFAGLSFAAPQKMQFEVKLEGLDSTWQNIGNTRFTYYHELPPGDYTFRVRASNNDGVWNETGQSLAISIPPFYWQTATFRIGIFALLIGLSIGLTWWIVHSRQRLKRQGDERFRLVVEGSPSAMVMIDAAGRILLANRQAEKSFGYSRVEMIGQPVEMLIPTRFVASHPKQRQDFFANPTARPMGANRELFGRRRDGSEFPVEVGLNPVQTAQGMMVLASILDITDRLRQELDTQRQRNELVHMSRVTMLGELSGSLAHELNQPLASILSNAQAAQRFLDRDATDLTEVRSILQDIVDEDKRAGEVIRRLRVLLKKGEVQRLPLNMNEVVKEVLQIVRSDLINHGVSVDLDLAADLPLVEGDRVQLQQVLLNLVMNACDAMATSPQRLIRVLTSCLDPAWVQVSVEDRGIGIAPDRLTAIFEPFITTKPSGMGMGLAVSRTIVTVHGGKLWASNNPTGGATFHFTLPAMKPTP